MYQIIFYVPASHLEQVKSALFSAGAGQFEHYSHCAWQTLGQGQFKPLTDSKPYLGEIDQIMQVSEYKVEMICVAERIEAAIATLISTHPYEQPAYSVHKILKMDDFSSGFE